MKRAVANSFSFSPCDCKKRAKSLQPFYNQKTEYLIKPQKSRIHKACDIKDLKNLQKM